MFSGVSHGFPVYVFALKCLVVGKKLYIQRWSRMLSLKYPHQTQDIDEILLTANGQVERVQSQILARYCTECMPKK